MAGNMLAMFHASLAAAILKADERYASTKATVRENDQLIDRAKGSEPQLKLHLGLLNVRHPRTCAKWSESCTIVGYVLWHSLCL